MTQGQAERHNPVLEEASRELEAAAHDAQVAFDCIALEELNRAHTAAPTARGRSGATYPAPRPTPGSGHLAAEDRDAGIAGHIRRLLIGRLSAALAA